MTCLYGFTSIINHRFLTNQIALHLSYFIKLFIAFFLCCFDTDGSPAKMERRKARTIWS